MRGNCIGSRIRASVTCSTGGFSSSPANSRAAERTVSARRPKLSPARRLPAHAMRARRSLGKPPIVSKRAENGRISAIASCNAALSGSTRDASTLPKNASVTCSFSGSSNFAARPAARSACIAFPSARRTAPSSAMPTNSRRRLPVDGIESFGILELSEELWIRLEVRLESRDARGVERMILQPRCLAGPELLRQLLEEPDHAPGIVLAGFGDDVRAYPVGLRLDVARDIGVFARNRPIARVICGIRCENAAHARHDDAG